MAAVEHVDQPGDTASASGTVGGLLALAALATPSGLVSAKTWTRIVSLAPVLPPAFAIAAFEVPLEAGASRVDFEVCIRRSAGERQALMAWLDGPALARLVASDAAWCRTVRFLRAWSDPASPLFDAVEVAWVEFDLARDRPPRPFVIFTLRRDGDEAPSRRDPRAAAVKTGLDVLSGGLDRDVAARVDRCLVHLRGAGLLLHAAVRPIADGNTVRLVIRIPRQRLPGFLERIGWPGDRDALAALLERLGPATLTQAVNLDVWRAVGPRVGIEYHFPTSPLADARWQTLLDGLVADGACASRKRSALARWCPPDDATATRLVRALLVKVVYETGRPLRAKAYLPFGRSAAFLEA